MSDRRPASTTPAPPRAVRSTPRPGRGLPAYRPVRSPLISMGPSLDEERRRHRTARTIAVGSVVAVVGIVLLVWFVGLLGREVVQGGAEEATVPAAAVLPAGPPTPQTLAEAIIEPEQPGLRLQLPINRTAVSGIGFGPRREPGVIELEPAGSRANLAWGRRLAERFLAKRAAGDLDWYRLGDGALAMASIGAQPGTDVYAPIDGTVFALADYVVSGKSRGVTVQIQPLGDGQTLVVLRNVDPSAELAVGQTVSEGATLLGHVRDMEGAVDAPLADYTHDSGAGVEMYVMRTELPPLSTG